MIGEIVVFCCQQGADEILGDLVEANGGAAHFAKLGDQLGVAAVDAQGDLQLNLAQRFDGRKGRTKVKKRTAETEQQPTKNGNARPPDKLQQAYQNVRNSK